MYGVEGASFANRQFSPNVRTTSTRSSSTRSSPLAHDVGNYGFRLLIEFLRRTFQFLVMGYPPRISELMLEYAARKAAGS